MRQNWLFGYSTNSEREKKLETLAKDFKIWKDNRLNRRLHSYNAVNLCVSKGGDPKSFLHGEALNYTRAAPASKKNVPFALFGTPRDLGPSQVLTEV